MSLNFLLCLSYLASVIKDGFLSQVMNELFGNEEEPFGEEGIKCLATIQVWISIFLLMFSKPELLICYSMVQTFRQFSAF